MNSDKYCQCGCGQITSIARVNDKSKGWTKGVHVKYIKGHRIKGKGKGMESPAWKGGRSLSSHGYVVLRMPDGSRRYEHVVIAEEVLGRRLQAFGKGHPNNEVVHHINGNKRDNRKSNLLICTHSYHVALHHKLENSNIWPEFEKTKRPGFGGEKHADN